MAVTRCGVSFYFFEIKPNESKISKVKANYTK
nr:MAG TPA: hypothetical protein [Caudoviricetes sp.]